MNIQKMNQIREKHVAVVDKPFHGAAVVEWLSSWLAEQEVGVRFPGLAT